jgi:hypothetical protein
MRECPAKSASFPKATHRCHSVRDSHPPTSFFHDVLVARDDRNHGSIPATASMPLVATCSDGGGLWRADFGAELIGHERCGQRVRGQHPEVAPDQYGATAHRLGPRVKAAAHTVHYGMGVPVRKLPAILREFSGIAHFQRPGESRHFAHSANALQHRHALDQ